MLWVGFGTAILAMVLCIISAFVSNSGLRMSGGLIGTFFGLFMSASAILLADPFFQMEDIDINEGEWDLGVNFIHPHSWQLLIESEVSFQANSSRNQEYCIKCHEKRGKLSHSKRFTISSAAILSFGEDFLQHASTGFPAGKFPIDVF